ncbi:MAG TPA: PilZ domain-containing protein [Bacillota bacterium]
MFEDNNNREYARLLSLLEINVVLDDQTVVKGQTKNIGFGGVQLELPLYIAVDQEVKLIIVHHGKPFTIWSKCIWSKPKGQLVSSCDAGFTFLSDDRETYERLRDLLNELVDNESMVI